jgi:hypothetical protein
MPEDHDQTIRATVPARAPVRVQLARRVAIELALERTVLRVVEIAPVTAALRHAVDGDEANVARPVEAVVARGAVGGGVLRRVDVAEPELVVAPPCSALNSLLVTNRRPGSGGVRAVSVPGRGGKRPCPKTSPWGLKASGRSLGSPTFPSRVLVVAAAVGEG